MLVVPVWTTYLSLAMIILSLMFGELAMMIVTPLVVLMVMMNTYKLVLGERGDDSNESDRDS